MTEFPSFMASLGETLISNGYSIIPIIPGMKIPGAYSSRGWTEMGKWSKYCERKTLPFEHAIWKSWPGCAIGLAMGNVIGIDIDIIDDPNKEGFPRVPEGDDKRLAIELEAMARRMLGDTPAMRIGRQPKRALYYRADKPFKGRKKHPLEIYGLGSQMVVYGIHPDTQRPYEWPDDELAAIDIERLPVITEAQAMAWLEAAYARVPDALRPKRLSDAEGVKSEWSGPSDPRGTLEAVKSAMAFIPNDDVDGSSWVRMCNALKAALGDEGRDIWLDWSKSSAKSGASGKSNTAERRWKSAKPIEVGAGSIYWMAEQRGWVPETHLILNAADAENAEDIHPAADMIAKFAALANVKRQDGPMRVTSGLMNVGGALRQIIDYATGTAISPQPFLALGAAICCVGTLAGRRYRTRTNLRTNVYAIGIADSGGGKDQARACVKEALFAAGLADYLGGEEVASGTALLSSLQKHPARIYLLDEFGKFVGSVTGAKVQQHRLDIWTQLTKLYTSAGGVSLGTEYGDQKLRPRVDIVQPCAAVYGVTVPLPFWEALENGALSDGSLARFLIFATDNDYPDRQDSPAAMDPPAALVEALQAIAAGAHPDDVGNLQAATAMCATTTPMPYVVPETREAASALRALMEAQTEWLRQSRGTHKTAIIARICENVSKLALIAAISENPAEPVITAEHVSWATEVVDHCVYTLLREADRYIADNDVEANHKWLLEIIKKAAGPISQNAISRQTQKLTRSQRDQILAALVESGQVVVTVEKQEGAGRPSRSYTAITVGSAERMRITEAAP